MSTAETTLEQYLLSIRVEEEDFYTSGDLKPSGEFSFWKEMDLCMKRFNMDKINLNPKKKREFTPEARDSHEPAFNYSDHNCCKLPTPPAQPRRESSGIKRKIYNKRQ